MLARLRPHLTFANVVSLLALRAQLGSWLRSVDTGGSGRLRRRSTR
jgi:hypothetical protein